MEAPRRKGLAEQRHTLRAVCTARHGSADFGRRAIEQPLGQVVRGELIGTYAWRRFNWSLVRLARQMAEHGGQHVRVELERLDHVG